MEQVKSKRQLTVGGYIYAVGIFCTISAMVVYMINANNSYYHDFGMKIPLLTVAAIVLEVVFLFAAVKFGEKTWMDIMFPVISVVLIAAAVIFISRRVESAAIILGSDLERDNALAMSAIIQAIVGIAFYVVSMLLVNVSGGFDIVKQKKES